jgi:hypothetical protein
MAKASIEFVGEERVSALIDKMNAKLDEQQKKLQELANTSKKGQDESARAMEKSIDKLVGLGAGYMTAQKALQMFNLELERNADLQRKSLDAQLKVADPQRAYFRNFQPANPLAAESQFTGLSKTSGIDLPNLYGAMNDARKQVATLSPEQQISALRESTKWAPESQGALSSTTGAIGQLMSQGMNAQSGAGLLQKIGKQSGAGFDEASARLLPSILQAQSFNGGSVQSSAALATAVFADPRFSGERGQRTAATTFENLSQKMGEFLPAEDRYEFDEKGHRRLAAKGTGMSSLQERLDALGTDPKLRERFMAQSKFSAKEEGAARDALTFGSPLRRRYASNLVDFLSPSDPAAGAAALDSTVVQQAGNIGRRIGSENTIAGLENPYAAGQQQARQIYDTFLDRTHVGGVEGFLKRSLYNIAPGSGPEYVRGEVEAKLSGARQGNPGYAGEDLKSLIPFLERQLQALDRISANQKDRGAVNPNTHNE